MQIRNIIHVDLGGLLNTVNTRDCYNNSTVAVYGLPVRS
jgi:hypothetical protein